LLVQIK